MDANKIQEENIELKLAPSNMTFLKKINIIGSPNIKADNKIVSINPKIIPYDTKIYINGLGERTNKKIDGVNILDNKIHYYNPKGNFQGTRKIYYEKKVESKVKLQTNLKGKTLNQNKIEINNKINKQITQLVSGENTVIDFNKDKEIKRNYTQEDLDILSKVIYAEAGTEDDIGQRLVGWVILNRINSPKFPYAKTIKDVVYAPNQFETVSNGSINKTPSKRAIINAQYVLTHINPDIENNLLYFNSTTLGETTPGTIWWKGVYTSFVYQNQVFAIEDN